MTFSNCDWLTQYASAPQNDQQRRSSPLEKLAACSIQQGVVELDRQELKKTIPALVTPMDERGRLGPSTSVDLKLHSDRDLSFHHQLPLSARRAFVSVEDEHLGSWEAIVNLNWCRFNRMGYYTSGGRFAEPAARTAS